MDIPITFISHVEHWRRDQFRVHMEEVVGTLQHSFFNDLYNYLFRGLSPSCLVYDFLLNKVDDFKEHAPHDYNKNPKWPYNRLVDQWNNLHAALPTRAWGNEKKVSRWLNLEQEIRMRYLIKAKLTYTEDELLLKILKS